MKQVSRRQLLVAMGGLSLAGLAAACGATPTAAPQAEAEATAAPASEATATTASEAVPQQAAAGSIKLVYWGHDHTPRVTLDKQYIEEFGSEHPEVAVEYVVSGEFDTKLRTALAAGTGPDLFAQYNGEIGQFFVSGVMAPVETTAFGLGSQQELMDEYDTPEATLAGCVFGGKLYGIPNEVSCYGAFLNRTLWEEAGVDPEADYTGYWDDFPAQMEQLTKRDDSGNINQRGWDFNYNSAGWKFGSLNCMAQQLGAIPVDKETYTATIDCDEMVFALQYVTDWVVKYNLGGPGYQASRDAFASGTLATEGTYGSWGIPGFQEQELDFVLQTYPTFREAKSACCYDTYAYFHMVNTGAAPEVQKAGWQLAYALSLHPEAYLADAGLLQPKKVLIASETFTNDPYLGLFMDQMRVNYYTPSVAGLYELREAVARAMDRCLTEGADPKESLTTAQQEVTEILSNAKAAAQGA